MLAALGGAYLSNGFLGSFTENMTAGAASSPSPRSSSATGGRSARSAPRSCSASRAPLRSRPAAYVERAVDAVLFQALPYVLTLIAVAGVIGRSIPPAAVGRPYVKQ